MSISESLNRFDFERAAREALSVNVAELFKEFGGYMRDLGAPVTTFFENGTAGAQVWMRAWIASDSYGSVGTLEPVPSNGQVASKLWPICRRRLKTDHGASAEY